jgi:hypothetical protein
VTAEVKALSHLLGCHCQLGNYRSAQRVTTIIAFAITPCTFARVQNRRPLITRS